MDGILVLAKPPGPTSHDMVALVRRLSGTKRVGHGGTLDPFAAGVLPIFLGRATRVVEYHLGATKRYRATLCFGAGSTTDDLDGLLTPATRPPPTREAVEAAMPAFRGEIQQRPPNFSAIQVGGRRAYAMARAGQAVELAPRTVTIHEISIVEWDATDPERPIATLDVACSAGTYVRAIARDLGEAVGSAAYLGALTRTASGVFRVEDARPLSEVREAAAGGTARLQALLLPVDAGLDEFPQVRLSAAEETAIVRGQVIRQSGGIPGGQVDHALLRLVDERGGLVAIGRARGPRIAPEKVLRDVPPPERATADTASPDPPRAEDPGPDPKVDTRLVNGIDSLRANDGPLFVVVGVFDGLHRGHDYLLGRLRHEAASRGARAAVITFDAHPDEILLGSAPPILVDPDERLVRLAQAGVEVTVVQHFDKALRMTPYQGFVEMITSRTRLVGLLMTPDAAFGFERRGTPDALRELGATGGFEVVVVPPFQVAGKEVRSADIRALIAAGDLVGTSALLGRPYAFVGERSAAEQGSLAGRRRDIVTFRVPVALPPPGNYGVTVEPAWHPGAEPGITAPATAVVAKDGDWVELRADRDLPPGERLRITLES